MVERKSSTLLVISLICFLGLLFGNISEEQVLSFDDLNEMQRNPNQLKKALDCTLSTLMYAEENFPTQLSAEMLLERIYSKLELTQQFSLDDDIFVSIIQESTSDLLNALKNIDDSTEMYTIAYPLMDFVRMDFSQLIEQFHYEKFKEYFEINKLKGFELIESLEGKQLQQLTNQIIETIIQNNYNLNNETYLAIVNLGKDKLLNYLSIQINPYLDKSQDETYERQFYLLKAYLSLYRIYYGETYQEKVPKDKYVYYLELADYYDYLRNVEILSRRLLTAEKETLSTLFPVFLDYIEQYEEITLKTEKLDKTLHSMIKNASTRFSYEKSVLDTANLDLGDISISDERLNESLMTLFSMLKTEQKEEVPKETNSIMTFINNPAFIITFLSFTTVLLLILFAIPLRLRATLFKSLGFNQKSLSLFEKAAIKNPMDPDIHIKTAEIYEKLGREEEAMNEYKIASKVMDMKED